MKTLRNRSIALMTASSLALLSACGGGGDSDTGGGNSPPAGGGQTVTKAFTVSLARVEVTRMSNGDAVDVDTDGITSSGSVIISQ